MRYALVVLMVCCLGCSAVGPKVSDAESKLQVRSIKLVWHSALESLAAGSFSKVIETDSDIVWFVDGNGVYGWSTRPAGYVWPEELLSKAEFHHIIVD